MYQFVVITNVYLHIPYSVKAPCFLRKTDAAYGEDLGIILCCQVGKVFTSTSIYNSIAVFSNIYFREAGVTSLVDLP